MAPAGSSTKFDTFLTNKYIPLERKVKILLAILLFLLPVVLFYFLFFSPKQDKIQGLEKQKVTLTTEVKKAKAAARNLKKYQDEVAEAQKRFAQTAIVLPKKKEIPNLLRNISDLGKGAGLDFLSFKPGSEIPKDFYAEIPVDIKIRGPYHNMGYFLDQVSKLNRIVTVNNIKMGSPKQEGGEMLLNSNCRLVTYRFTNTQVSTNDKDKKKKKAKK
jgi:type IV pilus assembly protein PilO